MNETKIHGLEELKRRLAKLPANVEKNILRSGVRKGAQTVRNAADVPGGKKSLKVSSSRSTERRLKAVAAGVGFDQKKFYLKFVAETGAAPHQIKPGKKPLADKESGFFALKVVNHPGIAERREVTRALENNTERIVDEISKQITKRLDKL